jgi:hypothetical protein
VNGTAIFVLLRGESFEQDLWGTAGEDDARKLGAKSATQTFRITERPRRASQSVRSSLDPSGKASSTGLNVIGNDDGSLSVGATKSTCEVAQQLQQRQ